MKWSAWVLLFLFAACRPIEVPEPGISAAPAAQPVDNARPPTSSGSASDATRVPHAGVRDEPPAPSITPPRVSRWSADGVTFDGVSFDARSHRLRVVDQADGPGSRFATAADAARSVGGLAAVNAGFFTPQGDPLGLVVAGGNVAGQWNGGSSLGTGLWLQERNGEMRIARRENVGAASARRMTELIQAGPMLVENNRAVRGLRGGDARPRTLIAWDGAHRWWIGTTTPCSLEELGAALAASSTSATGPGFRPRHALNLDGGRSSEFWAGSNVQGGPHARRSIFNRMVRNHLVLIEK